MFEPNDVNLSPQQLTHYKETPMKEITEYEITYLEGAGELVEKANQFLDHLKTQGKKERTLYTYGKDMEILVLHFGPGKTLNKITKPLMGSFLKCSPLLKTASGKDKSVITITKTKRVVSQFFDWRVQAGDLMENPMPKGN